ncbi:AAA family ATPase [Occultella glacieicola]|uniref:AAA family ATPase n=1 Tax=Occultella glacieicola TaxID=2518684 RepID=A0ABY2ECL5_9MICO|nr:RNA polymerase recycling motor ATPase HelR [Occultella glacieicola]TDE97584.1 AAA family ATPase [Occultella glacieicola]
MNPLRTSAFDLSDHLTAKADPTLIGADEHHFAAIEASLAEQIAELTDRLDTTRRAPGGSGQAALERDQEIHRLTARLRLLRRFGLDLCLGRMVATGDTAGTDGDGGTVYVGRLGLTDSTGRRLLVDWRSPAAEPFFGATHANPMGLASRRRYRWTGGRITDYWDEVFASDDWFSAAGRESYPALDDQSAFIASLGSTRSPRMRDVLGTIAADQDAIIRAGSDGGLVVDGGPGTGKTVVALHRTAYLLYADPRLGHRRGGVLFVGPHQPYLAYVSDVLPSLGEEGVRTATIRDLVPEGASTRPEADPEVARLKSSAQIVGGIERAIAFYEQPPSEHLDLDTEWGDFRVRPEDWTEAFAARDASTPHNEVREDLLEELITILLDGYEGEDDVEAVRAALRRNGDLRGALTEAWPTLEAGDVVGDLWSVPAYLRLCAPWLSREEIRTLQREDPQAWTEADLPLLDAARQRLGDPEVLRRRRRREAALAEQRAHMDDVVDDLIATDDSEMGVMQMLRLDDMRDKLVDSSGLGRDAVGDPLAGPFAHIVVDEAQELTDAQWQMLLLRCPSRSFTVVGDRAQARHGFTESWLERLERVGLTRLDLATLTINYRTPEEVMVEAEPVIRAALPDANVPTSVRSTGTPVRHARTGELDAILDAWLTEHDEGIAAVIGSPMPLDTGRDRVRALTPELAKGLEFDLVVLVDPESFGTGIEGAVDRYVAMTRATQELVILTSS